MKRLSEFRLVPAPAPRGSDRLDRPIEWCFFSAITGCCMISLDWTLALASMFIRVSLFYFFMRIRFDPARLALDLVGFPLGRDGALIWEAVQPPLRQEGDEDSHGRARCRR